MAFEEEIAKSADSVSLNTAMKTHFPDLGMKVAIDIGAKVATDEMKWS